jgi:hypothetical protein
MFLISRPAGFLKVSLLKPVDTYRDTWDVYEGILLNKNT